MAESKYYFLHDKKRLFDFPFRLKEVGWLPGHYHVHKNAVLKDVYVCMSSNWMGSESITEVNGVLRHAIYEKDRIHFSLIVPGTVYNTVKAVIHDELYFRFDVSSAETVCKLVGEHTSFYFQKWPETIMSELNNLLHSIDKSGVADKVDQLAVRLISEVILQYLEQSAQDKNNQQMRIYSVANELVNGRELVHAAKENGFSMRSFYRVWKRHFDISPQAYVQNKKLKKAVYFLTESNLNNIEIAQECGFENVKYFYAWFRKNLNMSPREYRRQNLQKQQGKLDC